MIPHSSFGLHFSSDVEHLFMCFFGIYMSSAHFFDWVVWFFEIEMYELYVYFRD